MNPIFLLVKLWRSLLYSLSGLSYIIRHELSFQLELGYMVVSLITLYFLPFTIMEKLLLISTLILLLVVEIINTAIEMVVDNFSLERSKFARHTKDLGSAAVFLIILASVVQWVVFFYPYLRKYVLS